MGYTMLKNSMGNRQYDQSSLEGAAVLFQRLFCDMGREYGTPERSERELVRQHKDMIPGFDLSQRTVSLEQAERNYDRLDQAERDKDSAPMECMLAMLRMFDGLYQRGSIGQTDAPAFSACYPIYRGTQNRGSFGVCFFTLVVLFHLIKAFLRHLFHF